MALFMPGVAVSQVSGRVGGTIFSHNRGGMYMRNGTKPKVVTSPEAQLTKAIMGTCSRAWASLSSKQRAAWKPFAVENPISNRLGQSRVLSPAQCYNMINARLLRYGAAAIELPPIGGPPVPVATFSAVADESDQSFELTFTATPVPASTVYRVWGTPVNSEAITYYQNRLVLVDQLAPAETTGYDMATNWVARFGELIEGQAFKLEIEAMSTATGLLSGRTIYSGTVQA